MTDTLSMEELIGRLKLRSAEHRSFFGSSKDYELFDEASEAIRRLEGENAELLTEMRRCMVLAQADHERVKAAEAERDQALALRWGGQGDHGGLPEPATGEHASEDEAATPARCSDGWLDLAIAHLGQAATALRQHGDEYRAQLVEAGAYAISQGAKAAPPTLDPGAVGRGS